MWILVRACGLIGLILCIIPFQFKKHKHIVLCKMASELTFAVQYFLLGAYTGALVDLISGARNFLYHKFVEGGKSTTPLIIGFSLFIIVITLGSWAGPISLLPMAAKVITTVSYGMKSEKLLRYITLPSCLCWIAYNIVIGAWEGMIADSLAFISILIAIYKFDIRK